MVIKDDSRLDDFSIRSSTALLNRMQESLPKTAVTDHGRPDKPNEDGVMTPIRTVLDKFRGRSKKHTIAAAVAASSVRDFDPPYICLKLGDNIDRCAKAPICIASRTRFALIPDLTDPDKESKVKDLASCQNWTIASQEDAIHLPYQDRHGLWTWVTILFGLKLWIYWPNMSQKAHDSFNDQGGMYRGQYGKARWVVLGPGDTMIMQSGTPHCVYSVKDSSMTGGHFWDRHEIGKILAGFDNEQKSRRKIMNEDPAAQAPFAIRLLHR